MARQHGPEAAWTALRHLHLANESLDSYHWKERTVVFSPTTSFQTVFPVGQRYNVSHVICNPRAFYGVTLSSVTPGSVWALLQCPPAGTSFERVYTLPGFSVKPSEGLRIRWLRNGTGGWFTFFYMTTPY